MTHKMDGGLALEIALRNAIDEKKDFDRFADNLRSVAVELGLSDDERDRIFSAIAKELINWDK